MSLQARAQIVPGRGPVQALQQVLLPLPEQVPEQVQVQVLLPLPEQVPEQVLQVLLPLQEPPLPVLPQSEMRVLSPDEVAV